MGFILWLVSGLVAFALARLLPRTRSRAAEVTIALVAAAIAGAVATALDFGGWNEPDPRSVLFAFLVAAASIAALRHLRFRS